MRNLLPQRLATMHFDIRYGWRSPSQGRGMAEHGVKDVALVLRYAESLELAYARFTSPVLRWKLSDQSTYKTAVNIYDTSLFIRGAFGVTELVGGIPIISLVSRGREPSLSSEFQRAAATAVHELTHAFNFVRRPPSSLTYGPPDPWEWFDEGTAVFMENWVYPENQDCLQYLRDWCDYPETPLDDPNSIYQAGTFVRFLYNRFGPRILTEVWERARYAATPFEALEAIFASRRWPLLFSAATPGKPDVFASGYCMDSYFLSDPASKCFSPEIWGRFGERMVSESFTHYPISGAADGDYLNHLACRYYRFRPPRSPKALTVTLEPENDLAAKHLRADLVPVSTEFQRRKAIALMHSSTGGATQLSARMPGFTSNQVDHAVLIVTNCSYGAGAADGLGYNISAQLT